MVVRITVAKKKILIKSLNTFMFRKRVFFCTGVCTVSLLILYRQKLSLQESVLPGVQLYRETKPPPPPKLRGKKDIVTEGKDPKKRAEKGQQTGKKENKKRRTDGKELFQKQVKLE